MNLRGFPRLLRDNQRCGYNYRDLRIWNEYGVRVRVRVRVTETYRQSVRLGAEPLEAHDQKCYGGLNPYGHTPYITSSLVRE
jgi:hypothetical protein